MENSNYYNEAINVMNEMYGKDVQMSLATSVDNMPSVRVVDLFYMDECFYATSYGLSNKANQIAKNPNISMCKGLFQCWGIATNIGNPLEDKNIKLREIVKEMFYLFYDKHVDEKDPNTCIIKIKLNKAVLFANDYKYIIDFENKVSSRSQFINDIVVI